MNILLVDDETIMIDIMKKAIDWESIGITHIYTANNANEARIIYKNEDIHIVVCDIEMPQENGLLLLQWMKKQKHYAEFIILTAYPDFHYAQNAVALQVNKYLLKPVSYEALALTIKEAAEKRELAMVEERFRKFGEKAISDEKKRIRYILRELIFENLPTSKEVFNAKICELGLSLEGIDDITLLYFHSKNITRIRRYGRIIRFVFENISDELFDDAVGCCFGYFPLLVSRKRMNDDMIREMCKSYQDMLKRHTKCTLNAYVLKNVSAYEVSEAYDLLEEAANNNVGDEDSIHFIEKKEILGKYFVVPFDGNKWEHIFSEENSKPEKILQQVRKDFTNVSKKGILDKKYLLYYQQEFLRLFYKKSEYNGLSENETYLYLFESAADSVKSFEKWVENLVSESGKSHLDKKEQSDVEKAMNYLYRHYNEEIGREDIEKEIHLNHDYLNRIFKAETGYSLMGYLQNYRIGVAKELLEYTEESIGKICQHVGYNSPPYFSKIFKKQIGITPVEYRKTKKN